MTLIICEVHEIDISYIINYLSTIIYKLFYPALAKVIFIINLKVDEIIVIFNTIINYIYIYNFCTL